MEQHKIDRINALAALARERELTKEEADERLILRREYIEEWKRGAKQVLDNTYILGDDGIERPLEKKGK